VVTGRHLNRFSDTCNQLLTLAAVIGREFSIEEMVLARRDMPRHQVLTTLDEAVAVRAIEETPSPWDATNSATASFRRCSTKN
jgi:hypothetical protein